MPTTHMGLRKSNQPSYSDQSEVSDNAVMNLSWSNSSTIDNSHMHQSEALGGGGKLLPQK